METRNQLVRKIIKYIGNEPIQFNIHPITGDLQIIFPNKSAKMKVSTDDTWYEIKRHIDKKMSNDRPNECTMCYNDIKRRATCAKCSNEWCIDCYIDIFRTNKGLIKCPFCRDVYGYICPEYMMERAIRQIKHGKY